LQTGQNLQKYEHVLDYTALAVLCKSLKNLVGPICPILGRFYTLDYIEGKALPGEVTHVETNNTQP
jgi:hypothetical protein